MVRDASSALLEGPAERLSPPLDRAASSSRSTAARGAAAPPCPIQNISPPDLGTLVLQSPEIADEDKVYSYFAPRSVHACQLRAWSLVTRSADGTVCVRCFRCKSWRCPGCRGAVARQDFARIMAGLGGEDFVGEDWIFLTLTFDRARYDNPFQAYQAGGRCWYKLLTRLRRRYGVGVGRHKLLAEIGYVAVWERHKSGWPHVHLLIRSPEIAREIRELGLCVKDADGYGPRRWDTRAKKWLPNWAWKARVLEDLAVASGFGSVSDVQFPRASEASVASYVTKLAGEVVGVFDQRPVNAPRGFRRLRTSRGMLPPRRRGDGTVTGRLVQARADRLLERLDRLALPAGPRRRMSRWRSTGCSGSIRRRLALAAERSVSSAASRLTSSSARRPRPQAQPDLPLPPPPHPPHPE